MKAGHVWYFNKKLGRHVCANCRLVSLNNAASQRASKAPCTDPDPQ